MAETDWVTIAAGVSLAQLVLVVAVLAALAIADAAHAGRRRQVREIMRQAGRDIDGAIREANKLREGGDR